MPLEQRLNIKMSQKLIMTPSLQQAIKLLQLSKLELLEEITRELVDNPVLEEGTEVTQSEEEVKDAASVKEKEGEGPTTPETPTPADDGQETFGDDFLDAFYENFLQSSYEPRAPVEEIELPSFEATLTKPLTLTDHLQWQLDATPIDEIQREIVDAIIGNLNDDGYLGATREEIQAMGPYAAEEVDRALDLIKGLDPPGVGASDLRECLLIQLRHLDLSNSPACEIVTNHFELLQGHRYQPLAQQLGCSMQELGEAIEVIKHLDPSPGLKYNTMRSQYVTPDVFVIKGERGEYKVLLNEDGMPRLRISGLYRRMLDRHNPTPDREARSYLREKVRAAHRFIKSLDERQRTIHKVATSIVKHERDFLDHGIDHMRPLILRDVAEDIGMHESTVSRVVNNKYMHTPRGLFELRYFFHAAVPGSSGEDISSLKVKDKIREIVTSEDPQNPLSDAHIVKLLAEEHGIRIARRTVAKYRGELRIPSSNDRRQPLA
ncbi:MAG TPA: RNA polymerase factor sigma-54 [Candidatus Saccharimonadales bacterium]|nr:RNA polymerase factor sigma-54 [Candidatus Saccharimonadales bacterium]